MSWGLVSELLRKMYYCRKNIKPLSCQLCCAGGLPQRRAWHDLTFRKGLREQEGPQLSPASLRPCDGAYEPSGPRGLCINLGFPEESPTLSFCPAMLLNSDFLCTVMVGQLLAHSTVLGV